MADQTLSALRELTNAVVDEFFGNDTNLSKRLIRATNEAQLLLMVQPPDDDRVNRPAPAEPVVLVEPVEAPTSDEREILLETARAAQVAGTFPGDSAIRLLTDDFGWNESERRHCMAAARLALAYWGHAWGCLTTNNPAPANPAELTDEELLRTYAAAKYNYRYEGPTDDWPRNEERALTVAGLRAVIAADRARRAAPPAEGEAGELVAWIYQQAIHAPDGDEWRRAADLLQQQAAELAECREALRRVRLEQRVPGGFW